MSSRANELADTVVKYLTVMGWLAWPQNNVGIYDHVKKVFRKPPKRFRKGVPDVLAVEPGGKFWGFEIKIDKDSQSIEQEAFQTDLESVGGRYIIVKDIGDVVDIFQARTEQKNKSGM